MSEIFDQFQTEHRVETDTTVNDAEMPVLWRTATTEAMVWLRELRCCPITVRQERILRMIASKYYQRGYCFARQETIAAAVGCVKSTAQLDLDELEARGLLAVRRRPGTSNLTLLAPGLIEALRVMRIERRHAALAARRGDTPLLRHVESYKKLATKAMEELATLALAASAKITALTVPKAFAPVVTEEKKVVQDFNFSNRPKAVTQPSISTTNSVSAKATYDDAKKRKDTVEKLCEAGVSPRQATQLVRLFGTDRVNVNLQLGLHKTAQNPGGFLAMAIRENYAASHVLPGSEAAAVRQREKLQVIKKSTQSVSVIKADIERIVPPPKAKLELLAEAFEQLPVDQKTEYEQKAKKEVLLSPPSWLRSLVQHSGIEHPAVRGTIRAKAMEFWQSLTGTSIGYSLPVRPGTMC